MKRTYEQKSIRTEEDSENVNRNYEQKKIVETLKSSKSPQSYCT